MIATRSRHVAGSLVALGLVCSALGAASAGETMLRVGHAADAAPGATIAVSAGQRLRVTASGALAVAMPSAAGCGVVSPRGCAGGSAARPDPLAPEGALVGTFVDGAGTAVSPAFFVGDAALVIVPPAAARLLLQANLSPLQLARGAFAVDVVAVGSPQHVARAGARRVAVARGQGGEGARADVAAASRAAIHDALRRLGFSAPPATVTAVAKTGLSAWLETQLHPAAIDDTVADAFVEAKPTAFVRSQVVADEGTYERRLVEREIASNRQVLEKLVMHWFDHFSIGNAKVGAGELMSHVEDTLRADALGNFKQLVADVTREPAMLIWLDNNYNDGSNPAKNPPNENYARELMQLFVFGQTKLNLDGSPVLDASGKPLTTYTQADVQTIAQRLSGFGAVLHRQPPNDPNTSFSVIFNPAGHPAAGTFTTSSGTRADPADASCADIVADLLAHDPSTAPFEAKELIQRIATENPSPRYVAAVAAVWAGAADAPDQIAQVVRAIVRDPEFLESYRGSVRDPWSATIGFAREVGVGFKDGTSAKRASDVVRALRAAGQEPFYPASVFSFYRPGQKGALLNEQYLLARWANIAAMTANDLTSAATNAALDVAALKTAIGSTDPAAVTAYLLDAMVDGDAGSLRTSLATYLGSGPVSDAQLRGAVWIVATSPEAQVE